jgi:hypothetical protein
LLRSPLSSLWAFFSKVLLQGLACIFLCSARAFLLFGDNCPTHGYLWCNLFPFFIYLEKISIKKS